MNSFDSIRTYQTWKDFINTGEITKEVIREEIVESWKRAHHLPLKYFKKNTGGNQ